MASAGTPYRLVPAHFYPWGYVLAVGEMQLLLDRTHRTHSKTMPTAWSVCVCVSFGHDREAPQKRLNTCIEMPSEM